MINELVADNKYQVGGSLKIDDPNYVVRQADSEIYRALLQNELCYVFNCRQMGKSSLRVRVKQKLQEDGFACVSLDMTNIGSKEISADKWYKSIASELWRGFNLMGKVKFKSWWQEQAGLSPVRQLNLFVTDVIFPHVKAERIFIFIDEIDSVLSLDFSTDDFFALIRYFYNARAEIKEFDRLNFALFGVTTPNELIGDPTRTPFNIGKAIELKGFTTAEAESLVSGLQGGFKDPKIVLEEIIHWTGGQPFLAQKLCDLALKRSRQAGDCPLPGNERDWIEQLVRERIIDNWETQDQPEHLKTIRDRLTRNEATASRLLGLAQQVAKHGFIPVDNSAEQQQLLLTNLVIRRNSQLIFRNPIYQQIFNLNWLEQQLDRLRPYGREVDFWLASDCQDTSRLLRGNALEQAQAWARNHSISQEEYQFLNASQEQERAERERDLEFNRLREVETRLIQERKLAKLQRFLLSTIGSAFIITVGLSITAYVNYRQAKLKEIEAHVTSSESLFNSGRNFDALLDAIKAKEEAQSIIRFAKHRDNRVDLALQQTAFNAIEQNTFSGHQDIVNSVSVSPDGKLIASASSDTTVKIWHASGKLLTTLQGHQDSVVDVAFSPQGNILASAGEDNNIKIWTTQGELKRTIVGHKGSVHRIAFSPKGDLIASASEDRIVKLWDIRGNLQQALIGHQAEILAVNFAPDGQTIATGDRDGVVKFWNYSGELLNSFSAHPLPIRGIDFSPDSEHFVTGGDDNVARIWRKDGKLLKTLGGYKAPVTGVAYAPDGKTIGTSSWDGSVRLWHRDGTPHSLLSGHQSRVWRLAWIPDSQKIVTAGWDNVIKLWNLQAPLVNTFYGHDATVLSVAFHPQGKYVASASDDRTVKLWNLDGTIATNFQGHSREAYEVAFSPNGDFIASTSLDRTVKLWRDNGTVVNTDITHDAPVTDVDFAPKGERMVSAGFDRKIKFWQLQVAEGEFKVIPQKTINAHQAIITDIDISQDGNLIASVSHDRYLKLWQPNGNLMRSIAADTAGLKAVSISPDGQTIATGGKDRDVKLWNLQGELINTLEGHSAIVLDVEYSPDGQLIASASGDNTVKIWNEGGELLTTLRGHRGRIWNVAFSPDGKQIVSSAEDKTVKLWDLARILQLDPLKYSCHWIEDYLQTNVEFQQHSDHHLCH